MGTNLLNCVFDGDSIYYAFISGLIAMLAGLLMRTGMFRKWWGYILAVLLFSFFGGGVGSVLTYFLYGQSVDVVTPSLTADLYNNFGFTPFWANYVASTLWDMLDKTITMAIVLGVFLLYPNNERALEFFPNTFMLRKPWNVPAKRKFYQHMSIHSLDFKIISIMTFAYVLLASAVAMVLGISYHNNAFDEAGDTARQYATAVTYVIDGDEVNLWMSHQDEIKAAPTTYGYSHTFAGLESIKISSNKVLDVYVFTTDGKTVLDLEYGVTALGEPLHHQEEYEEFLKFKEFRRRRELELREQEKYNNYEDNVNEKEVRQNENGPYEQYENGPNYNQPNKDSYPGQYQNDMQEADYQRQQFSNNQIYIRRFPLKL
jgi:hypothetical protein